MTGESDILAAIAELQDRQEYIIGILIKICEKLNIQTNLEITIDEEEV